MPEFYMIKARKINKVPEFYLIFARKYLSQIWGRPCPLCSPSPMPMYNTTQDYRMTNSLTVSTFN